MRKGEEKTQGGRRRKRGGGGELERRSLLGEETLFKILWYNNIIILKTVTRNFSYT